MRVRRQGIARARRSGAAVVELAAVAPLFIMLILGQLESSRLGMVAQVMETAAREACRVAVLPGSAQSDVQARLDAITANSGISLGTITAVDTDPGTNGAYIMTSSWATSSGGSPITVTLRVPFSQVSWLPTPYFLNTAVITASATLSSERP
jgi:Flp pilus assembly protein TadG